jgi:hypothetical protein
MALLPMSVAAACAMALHLVGAYVLRALELSRLLVGGFFLAAVIAAVFHLATRVTLAVRLRWRSSWAR